mgnify:CR=1 FL=1
MAAEKQPQQTITVPQLKYLRTMERNKYTQLAKRKRMATRLMGENKIVKESLKELVEGNKDTIIPLGAGIYVQGSIASKSFKRTLPGNVVIASTKEEIEKELTERDKLYAQDLTILDKELLETRKALESMNALLQMARNKQQK